MEIKKSIFYEKPLSLFIFVIALINFTAKTFRNRNLFYCKFNAFMVITIFMVLSYTLFVKYFVTTNSFETLTLLMLSFLSNLQKNY